MPDRLAWMAGLCLAAACAGSTAEPPRDGAGETGPAALAELDPEPAPARATLGEPAPDFELDWLGPAAGRPRAGRLSDLRGRVVLLEFWRTWCAACLRSVPRLNALHREFAEQGLAIVAVSNEDDGLLADAAASAGMEYPLARVEGREVDAAYGVRAIPRSFLLDRRGRIVWEGHPAALTAEQVARALE